MNYYFSSRHGDDQNDGRSPQSPWRTLHGHGQLHPDAGSRLLLERGSVFEDDYLHLENARGTADAPILVGAYGDGAENPVIHTNGTGRWYQDYGTELDDPNHCRQGWVSSAILLYDCAYIEVSDISVTNRAVDSKVAYNALDAIDRTGVAVVAQNGGTLHHIHLKGLTVEDVEGNVYNKHMCNGGIYFVAHKPEDEKKTGIARYQDILVESCRVARTSRCGIALAYTAYWDKFTTKEIPDSVAGVYGATEVVVRGNAVFDAGGDGIVAMYCLRPLVEHNYCHGAARQMNKRDYRYSTVGRVAAGIWPWKCKDALLQYNEVCHTRYHNGENQDGQAFDADWGDGTVYRYNYSHDNEGGCLMICGEEAVNTLFFRNVSCNDDRAALIPAGSPLTRVIGNTFRMKPGVPFLATNSDAMGVVELEENTIFGSGRETWQEETATYRKNVFWGYTNIPEPKHNTRAGLFGLRKESI